MENQKNENPSPSIFSKIPIVGTIFRNDKEDLNLARQQISTLEQKKLELEQEIDGLKQKLSEKDSQIDTLNLEINKEVLKVHELEDKLQGKESFINFIKNQQVEHNEKLQSDNKKLKSEFDLLRETILQNSNSPKPQFQENDYEDIQSKYEILKKKYKEAKETIDDLLSQKKDVDLKAKKTIKKLKLETEGTNETLEYLKHKNKKLKNKNNRIFEEKMELEKEVEKLNKKYTKIYEKYRETKNKTSENYSKSEKKKNFPAYDLIININSLKTSEIGWEIEKSRDYPSKIRDLTTVGIVGRENTGKTFILNKICGLNLPSGCVLNTKGLSVKFSNNNSFVCLDSGGLQTPVFYYDETVMMRYETNKDDLKKNQNLRNEMINDRTLTDLFIQDFILDTCEVIIIVVGQLSQNDQKFIERISQRYKIHKRIIIVHNFLNLKTKQEVKQQIKKDIFLAFDVTPRNIPDSGVKEYLEKNSDKLKENITHLVLAAENHESGLKYNEFSLGYLEKILQTRPQKISFDPIERLIEFFEENYLLYLQLAGPPQNKVTLELNNTFTSLKILCDKKYSVSHPIFNSLGSLISTPPFDLFYHQELYVFLINLPYIELQSLKTSINKKKSEYQLLVLSGSRMCSDEEKACQIVFDGRMKGEKFEHLFPICKLGEKLEILGQRMIYRDGLLKIFIKTTKEEEEEIKYN